MAYTIRQYTTKAGKRYEVRYRKPDGSSTGRRGFKRKMDADAWGAANVTTAKSVGAYIDPQAGRRLVEDFWEPWLAAKKTKAKPSYIKSLEDAWRVHVEPQWGMREMQSITRDEVQRWVTDLAGRRSASVTIRAENLLRSLMERAKADRCIHDNPCDGIELPRKQVRKHVYLSADELSRVAMQCGWREPIVLTLGLCGMRWGELVALRVEDVDLQRCRLHIYRSITRLSSRMVETDPKTHDGRSVMFPLVLRPLLARQCEGRRPSDFLFTAPGEPLDEPMGNGWNPTRSDGWFAVALRRAGVDRGHMTIHDLRHTAASLMVQSGANVKTVQRQLGHKSAAMTLDVYADLFDDDLDELSERMGGLLFSQNVGKMWAKATQGIDGTVETVGG